MLSGKKGLLTILLAGLCLNLSTLHLHSIDQYLAKGENSGLHYTQDEIPFCFACKHLNFGDLSSKENLHPVIPAGQGPQLYAREVIPDNSPDLHPNKSPPASSALQRSTNFLIQVFST